MKKEKKVIKKQDPEENISAAASIEAQRQLGRMGFHYFLKEIMDFRDINDTEHKYWCKRAQDLLKLPPSERKLLVEGTKDTFKTTIFTIGFPMWLLIQDSDYWGKNLTSFLGNGDKDKAKAYIQEIRDSLKKKTLFRACYGDFNEDSDEWTKSKLTVERPMASKDATFLAVSTKTPVSSSHPKLIVLDDWSNEKNSRTPSGLAEQTRSLKEVLSTLDKNGIKIVHGHRFHYKDIFWHLTEDPECLDRDAWNRCLIKSPAREDGREDGKIMFPNRLPEEVLQQKRRDIGSALFKTYYLLDPSGMKGSKFKLTWLEKKYVHANEIPKEAVYVAGVDLCTGVNPEDPATDYFAMCLLALDYNTRYAYLVEIIREKITFPEQLAKVKHYTKLWTYEYQLQRVFIESVQMQVAMPQMLAIDPEMRGFKFDPIKTSKNKEMRLDGLSVVFERGCFYINEDMPGLIDFQNEYMEYPASAHDDQLDVIDLTSSSGWAIMDSVMEDRKNENTTGVFTASGSRETME